VTAVVDLTRDTEGRLHARLPNVVPGRSGTACAGWLRQQAERFIAGIEHAALYPFRGYANAIRDELPDAVAVLDAANPETGRKIAERVRASFPTCPIPELVRLGRTLRAWRQQVLAYFATKGVSNGGTEAINLLIEKTRRLAHGFTNFANYRLRIMLVAERTRPYRPRPNHA
jgi:transposase